MGTKAKIKSITAILLCLYFVSVAATAASFNYLYIEASEGNSSGGHSAIQFDDQIYHYQYVEPGLIRLFKQDKNDFHFSYRYLQNRPIHLSQIEVSEETLNLLEDNFQWQFLEQEQQFKQLEVLRKDRLLIQWLLHKKVSAGLRLNPYATSVLQLHGVGLFYSGQSKDRPLINTELKAQQSKSVTRLRHKIEQYYGADYLVRARQNIEAQIKALQPDNRLSFYPLLPSGKLPGSIYLFADKYSDYLTGLFAIKVMLEAQPLQSDAFFIMNQNVFEISATEKEVLLKLRDQLETSLLKSFSSGRPDWGYAVLINIARYIAIDASLQSGHWVFLDDFTENAARISVDEYNHHKEQMRALTNDARTDLDRLRQVLANSINLSEAGYSRMELAANRYFELLKGEQQITIRFNGQKALPGKSIDFPNQFIPELSNNQLTEYLTELESYESNLMQNLEQNYRYDLVSRNCVTAIFKTINSALSKQNEESSELSQSDAQPVEESERRLGGYVAIPYNFIPFFSYQLVKDHYNVTDTEELNSYRHLEMAKLYAKQPKLFIDLRESNILTSTLYSYNPDDALFVFFTDDNFLLRPIFGLINTATGIGQSLVGFLSLPFDSGKKLKSGATGILMSLPELFFVNMRKGSYKYLSYNQLAFAK